MADFLASPTHVLALVKGTAEGDPIKHTTALGLGTHLGDAVTCGLLTTTGEWDPVLTGTGRALYETHLSNLPDGRANHWGNAVPAAAVDHVRLLHLEATGRLVTVEAELTGSGHGVVTVLRGTRRARPPQGTLGRTRNAAGRASGWYVNNTLTQGTPAADRATGRTKNDAIRQYLRTLGIRPDAITYARIHYTVKP
ncbi:hypothetical protein [Streptomyces sp. CAU 1734]|uniref:hypothetical protein n=1 Tax=Streptomyces sp. CAU 1734 TaxID=3140360 RepID=UPI003260D85E